MWSVSFKEQEDDTAAAIAIFANGEEMILAGTLHGDVKTKTDLRCRPSASGAKKGKPTTSKSSKHVVATAEHPFFGTMKVTSQVNASKQRFAVLASTKRSFVSQVSSQMVSSIDIGHKVMRELMAKMLDNPDVIEKVELYKLRDEILKKIKSEGESKDEDKDINDKGKDKDEDKDSNDKGKDKGRKDKGKDSNDKGKDKDKDSNVKGKDKGKGRKDNGKDKDKDQKKATGKTKDAKHEEGEKKDTKHEKKAKDETDEKEDTKHEEDENHEKEDTKHEKKVRGEKKDTKHEKGEKKDTKPEKGEKKDSKHEKKAKDKKKDTKDDDEDAGKPIGIIKGEPKAKVTCKRKLRGESHDDDTTNVEPNKKPATNKQVLEDAEGATADDDNDSDQAPFKGEDTDEELRTLSSSSESDDDDSDGSCSS